MPDNAKLYRAKCHGCPYEHDCSHCEEQHADVALCHRRLFREKLSTLTFDSSFKVKVL